MIAILQLIRLPALPTALADILLGYWLTRLPGEPIGSPSLLILLVASGSLYSLGMVLNDLADLKVDKKERPNRPIPSGAVSEFGARVVAMVLATVALGATLAMQSLWGPAIAAALLIAILLYDFVLKETPLGPWNMGLCRGLNVLLGMSGALNGSLPILWLLIVPFHLLYVAGFTLFGRQEAEKKLPLNKRPMQWGILLAMAGLVGQICVAVQGPRGLFAVILLGSLAGQLFLHMQKALRESDPKQVPARIQRSVRLAIFGIVVVDAVLLLAYGRSFEAVIVLFLLVPTLTIGRWLYAT